MDQATPTGRVAPADQAAGRDRRVGSAAVIAALVAVPLAVVAGWLSFRLFTPGPARPAASAPTVAPVPSATVSMPAPSLAPAAATMCLAFIAKLPATLRNLPQRWVSAGREQNAAYGEPPITVACGGPPASVPPDALLVGPRDVCWYADRGSPGATRWTTLDRQVPVTVTVPDRYQGQGDWIQEFTAPIVAAVPSLARPPAFCAAPSVNPS